MSRATTTTVTRRYHFEAAHWLPGVPEGHRCRRMHGHNYEVEITLAGPVDHRGFIMDFFELDRVVEPIIGEIDHRTLNGIPGLENPTAELIAEWFLTRLENSWQDFAGGIRFAGVRVYETKDCWAEISRS